MANDTFDGIARKVLLRCPSAPITLAYDWIRNSFRDIVERRRWSWLLRRGSLTTTDQYTTGTASVAALGQTITLAGGGTVSSAHVGLQFRFGVSLPIVTITAVNVGANTYTIDQVISTAAISGAAFSVYQAYVAVPSDFHAFVTVTDPSFAQPIPFDATVGQIDNLDPQRAASGSPPKGLAWFDYYTSTPGNQPLARYELWPHQRVANIYPMIYECRPVDPFDANAIIPAMLPSDIVLERALMYCALWPGPSSAVPNPYFGAKLGLAQFHQKEYESRLAIIEKQDNEHMQQNIWYQSDQMRRTPVVSGNWLQSHDMGGL